MMKEDHQEILSFRLVAFSCRICLCGIPQKNEKKNSEEGTGVLNDS
jgi:hypothetical protein